MDPRFRPTLVSMAAKQKLFFDQGALWWVDTGIPVVVEIDRSNRRLMGMVDTGPGLDGFAVGY